MSFVAEHCSLNTCFKHGTIRKRSLCKAVISISLSCLWSRKPGHETVPDTVSQSRLQEQNWALLHQRGQFMPREVELSDTSVSLSRWVGNHDKLWACDRIDFLQTLCAQRRLPLNYWIWCISLGLGKRHGTSSSGILHEWFPSSPFRIMSLDLKSVWCRMIK